MDSFWISAEGMRSLMRHLRANKLALTAQVHSHPRRAFHSKADDTHAIVRQEGALSIVVPYFGKTVDADSFAQNNAFFRLAGNDEWVEITRDKVPVYFEVTTS